MFVTRRLSLPLVFIAVFAAPASAVAETRYVGNPGGGPAPCTNPQNPCMIFTAIDVADPGDTISIRRDPNHYDIPSGLTIDKRLRIVGAPGPRPLIRTTGGESVNALSFVSGSAGSELRHLRIETPNGAVGVAAPVQVTLADLEVDGAGACAWFGGAGSTIADSSFAGSIIGTSCVEASPSANGLTVRGVRVTHNGAGTALLLNAAGLDASDLTVDSGGVGIDVSGGANPGDAPATLRRAHTTSTDGVGLRVRRDEGGGPLVVSDVVARNGGGNGAAVQTLGGPVLRNVTGISPGSITHGLRVLNQLSNTPTAIDVRNCVFRGGDADVSVAGDEPATPVPGGTLPPKYRTPTTVRHSNFATLEGTLEPGSGNNQSGDPLFTNLAGGDLHPLAGSPLIDAGTADSAIGSVDLDGRSRTLGAAPDVGAYEFPPPPTPSAPEGGSSGPGGAGESGPVGGPTDLLAPQLTSLGLTNRSFAVGPAATPVTARAKRGTTFRLTLNEAATVVLVFERSEPGRRRGRRCVKQTRRNRKARKCRRWVKRGQIQRTANAGRVTIPFSGRIGRKALRPGSYRALVTARDAASNVSQQRTVNFKIVRR